MKKPFNEKPDAFPDGRRSNKYNQIRNVIIKMKYRQIALALQSFSGEDLMAMFVDPKHRHVLAGAWRLVEPSGSTQHLHVAVPTPDYALGDRIGQRPGTLLVRFEWHRHNCKECFYVPYEEGAREEKPALLRSDAPLDLAERFNQTTTDLIDIHWRFSQAEMVFHRLNRLCRNPAEVRYVWPCIYTLAGKAKLDEADALAEASYMAGRNVSVPSDLLPLLKPTNDTIMSALLFDGVDKPEPPTIQYNLLEDFPTR